MALSPSKLARGVWRDPWIELSGRSRLYDQHFGNMLTEADFLSPPLGGKRLTTFAPRLSRSTLNSGMSELLNNDHDFRVTFDVVQFKPEEISVKTRDRCIIISGTHEERTDNHGYITREFTRQYFLPKDRKGREVRIFFYLDNNKSEPYFCWSQLDRGNFLCLEHAYIHTFLDGTTGIRVDDACDVSIIGD